MGVGGYYLLITKPVQNLVGQRLLLALGQKTNTVIRAGNISFKRFKDIKARDFYIEDEEGDTLIFAPLVVAQLDSFDIDSKYVKANFLDIEDAIINFKKLEEGGMNFTFLVDSLYHPELPDSLRWKVHFNRISLAKSDLTLSNSEGEEHFRDLDTKVLFQDEGIAVDHLKFQLSNGFTLSDLSTLVSISDSALTIPSLSVSTPYSAAQFRDISLSTKEGKLNDSPNDSLRLHFVSNQSYFAASDLKYILPEGFNIQDGVVLDGEVSGILADVYGKNLHFKVDDIIDLDGTLKLKNVLHPEIFSYNLAFNALEVDVKKSCEFYNTIAEDEIDFSMLYHWGKLQYKGELVGTLNKLYSNGIISTKFGQLHQDFELKKDDSLKHINYKGKASSQSLDVGGILKNNQLYGDIAFDLEVKGKHDSLNTENYFTGLIPSLSFMGYDYKNLSLDGSVDRRYFNGILSLNDPNAEMDFSGEVDFSTEKPVFNFSMLMHHIDLAKVNILPFYDQFSVSFDAETQLEGNKIDELNGYTDFYSLGIATGSGAFSTDSLHFTFKPLDAQPSITLESDYVNAEIIGSYNFAELPGFINQSLRHHLRKLPMNFAYPTNITPNDFYFKVEIDDMYELAEAINFPIRANGYSTVAGRLNSRLNTFTINGEIPYLMNRKQILDSIYFSIHNDFSSLRADVDVAQMTFISDHILQDISLSSQLDNDTLSLDLECYNDDLSQPSASFMSKSHLQPYGRELMAVIDILPSSFILSDTIWHLRENQVSILPDIFTVDSFLLESENSHLIADGTFSDDLDDTLHFDLQDFDLKNIDRFLNIKNTNFSGLLSGKANLYSILGSPVLDSKMNLDSMVFNESSWGDLTISSGWDNQDKALDLILNAYDVYDNTLNIEGRYVPGNDSLELTCRVGAFPIDFLRPYLKSTLANLKGTMNGNLLVEGSLRAPELYGAVKVADGRFSVDYLSTDYFLNDSIIFDNNRFVFDNTKITDQEGNVAIVNGEVVHQAYKDMVADLVIASDRFLALNNTAAENEHFYGDVYFGGAVTIESNNDGTLIGSTAKTMEGSVITVPLAPVSVANTNNFIRYKTDTVIEVVERREQLTLEEVKAPSRPLVIDMNFEVTDATMVRLEVNAASGDVIESVGNGNLNLQFQYGQPFQMFGLYEISKGDYFFSLQQIFNKRFKIIEGSSLRWSGPPDDAEIDIIGQYSTKASLYNLMPDAIGESNKNRRVPVNVQMLLSQRLSQPNIQFEIELPNTNEQTQQSVSSVINSEEEMSRQVLSLLIMNSFYTPEYYTDASGTAPNQANNQISSVAAVTASEFLSNQLSNWVSQIHENLDLGLRYVPEQELEGEGLTPQEYEMAISTQFFNDRLTVNGNFGYQDYTNTSAPTGLNNNFVGEMDVELKLTENLKLKAYSRQNDDILYESSTMKQGAGISYEEDFTTLKELGGRYKQRVKNLFTKKDKTNAEAIERKEEDEVVEEE